MEYLTSKKFSFVSNALPPDTFGVVGFKGTERLSAPYRFEITLVSSDPEIDFGTVMRSQGRLILHREEGGDTLYSGIVANFEQLHEVKGFAFYRAHLVPKLWWLSITHHNQIFLGKTVPEMCEAILRDGGMLSNIDFEFRLQGTYDPVEYACQYGESHLNFLSRWCEREGIYYYFEQSERAEKIIFTDTKIAHTDPPGGGDIVYAPPSGLEALHSEEAVRSFQCRKNLLPAKVLLRDYNYRRPTLEIRGTADVDENGRGTVYFYHEHFRTGEEGDRLAKIRAEGLICQGEEYYGETSVPSLLPGFTYALSGHYRPGFNGKYLMTEVGHEGDQTGFLLAGISPDGESRQIYYRNRFTAIPAATQFRPQVETRKPKVHGSIPARIDGAGSGTYAELDEMGRYKVIIPYDLSGRADGKASSWIRMAEPYSGSNHGMHFPLHKGTEVLLTFVNGDPDRPIIAAAVPNPATPSPVTSANQTASLITTSGGNHIHMEDQEGSQRIQLHSPTAGSTLRLGSPAPGTARGPLGGEWEYMVPFTEGTGIYLATNDMLSVSAQFKNEVIMGNVNSLTLGAVDETVIGGIADVAIGGRAIISIVAYTDITLGAKHEFAWKDRWKFTGTKREVDIKAQEAAKEKLVIDGINKSIADRKDEITNLSTSVDHRFNQIVEECNQAFGKVVQYTNDEVKAVKTRVKAAEKEIATTQDEIKVVSTKVDTVEEHVTLVNSRVESMSLEVKEVETQVESLAVQSTSAEVVNQTAALINQGM